MYRYPVQVKDGRGGYRTAYNVIRPGAEELKVDMVEWEEAHLGEKYAMKWNSSLDCIAGGDDKEVDKSHVLAGDFLIEICYKTENC